MTRSQLSRAFFFLRLVGLNIPFMFGVNMPNKLRRRVVAPFEVEVAGPAAVAIATSAKDMGVGLFFFPSTCAEATCADPAATSLFMLYLKASRTLLHLSLQIYVSKRIAFRRKNLT